MASLASNSSSDKQETEARPVVIFLAVCVLAALLNAEVVFANRGGGPPSLRVLGWAMRVYSLGVTVYVAYWLWQVRRGKRGVRGETPNTDALTGLLNWNGLVGELARESYAQAEGDRQTRLIHIELSDLERVNHDYGNPVGDRVVQELASLLTSSTPEGWAVGRVGGREFAVVAPMASTAEIGDTCETIKRAIKDFSLDVGRLGKVDDLRVSVSSMSYSPGEVSLHKVLAGVRGGSTLARASHGGGGAPAAGCYHLPEITLGAVAARRSEELGGDDKVQFHLWRQAPVKDFVNVMAEDMAKLVDMRAEKGDLKFVTIPPFPADAKQDRAAAEALGRKLAERLGIPFRVIFRCTILGSDVSQRVEPEVDSAVKAGAGVLLVQDVISSSVLMRRCVRALSRHGCHVLSMVWAIQPQL